MSETTSGRRPPGEAAPKAPEQPADGVPNRKRELNKASNRAELLAAACEVFTELGYGAATVRDIIRRTHLASGTFYNYFPDKESVFRALLEESEARRNEWLRNARIRKDDIEGYLTDSFRAYFEFVAADRTLFALMRRNAGTIRAFSDDPVIVGEVRRFRRALEERMDRGALPPLDPAYLASAMYGIAFELAVRMVDRDPIDVDGATEFAADLFLGLIERTRRLRRPARRSPAGRTGAPRRPGSRP